MEKYGLTWNCQGMSIFCYFQLIGVILRYFQPSAKSFTRWLFFQLPYWLSDTDLASGISTEAPEKKKKSHRVKFFALG